MCPVQLVENEEVVTYPVIQAQLTQRYTRASLDFMRRAAAASQPFFLYLAHAMPHKPLAASEAFYTPDTPDDLYEDVIRKLDWSVGKILKTLRQLDIDQNTLLIFTSDNGATYGGTTAAYAAESTPPGMVACAFPVLCAGRDGFPRVWSIRLWRPSWISSQPCCTRRAPLCRATG